MSLAFAASAQAGPVPWVQLQVSAQKRISSELAASRERKTLPVDPEVLAAVLAALETVKQGKVDERIDVCEQILGRGPAVVPVVCGLLCGDLELPVELDAALEPLGPPELAQLERDVLLECLRRSDAELVIEHLVLRCEGAPLSVRLAAADLLGHVDHERSSDALLELIEGIDPLQLESEFVQRALNGALARQLLVTPDAARRWTHRVRELSLSQRTTIARAAGACASPTALRVLAGLIGSDPRLDRVAVRELISAALHGSGDLDAWELDAVRTLLAAPDSDLRRLACGALGVLGDVAALESILHLLDDEEPLVREAALRCLQKLSGVDLGPQSDPWWRWLGAEDAWWREQAPAELERLDSSDPREVHLAIATLVRHPLHRHEIAGAIGWLAAHEDAGIAAAACRALARLRSREALPGLLEALAVGDEASRALSVAVLRDLTGLELPADYLAWSRALMLE
jgi:HEAT repeat protein